LRPAATLPMLAPRRAATRVRLEPQVIEEFVTLRAEQVGHQHTHALFAEDRVDLRLQTGP
jgi:hypothetical protein